MSIPGTETIEIQSFEIVPGPASMQMVVQGVGRTQALILRFAPPQVFDAAAKTLAAADRIDHGQVVAVIREIYRRMFGDAAVAGSAPSTDSTPAPAPASASGATPAVEAPAADPPGSDGSASPEILLLEFAIELQTRAREAELSDALTAELFRALTALPEAKSVAATVASSRAALGISDGGGAPSSPRLGG